MEIGSSTRVSLGLEADTTLADLRELLAEAERLGAPDDAKAALRSGFGVLVASLVVEWAPQAVVGQAPLSPAACRCLVTPTLEAAPPGHENHRRADGTMPPQCWDAARRAAWAERPDVTVITGPESPQAALKAVAAPTVVR